MPSFADPSRLLDVPLEEFDLIYTEGDRNNTRSIRVRYNAMLAQAAYDGAAPRAMAVEDLPHPVPAHVFLRGNPNNPGALTPPHFLSCLGGSDEKVFQRRQRAAGTGTCHHRSRESADGARHRESRLDAPLRFWAGPHTERLRLPRRSADASGAARLSRGEVRGVRLVAQEAAPAAS